VPGLILCFLYVICLSAGRGAIEKSQLPKEVGLWWIHGIFVVVAIGLYQLDKVTAPFRALASMFKRKPKVGTS
jgi:lipopolysaccharide export LptBFGC system permease protein LptF